MHTTLLSATPAVMTRVCLATDAHDGRPDFLCVLSSPPGAGERSQCSMVVERPLLQCQRSPGPGAKGCPDRQMGPVPHEEISASESAPQMHSMPRQYHVPSAPCIGAACEFYEPKIFMLPSATCKPHLSSMDCLSALSAQQVPTRHNKRTSRLGLLLAHMRGLADC